MCRTEIGDIQRQHGSVQLEASPLSLGGRPLRMRDQIEKIDRREEPAHALAWVICRQPGEIVLRITAQRRRRGHADVVDRSKQIPSFCPPVLLTEQAPQERHL